MSDELAERRAAKEPDDLARRIVGELNRLGTGIETLAEKWAADYPEVAQELNALLRGREVGA